MDIYNLEKHLELAASSGATLSVEERLRIGLALDSLTQDNQNIDEFKFWGRIETPTKNYYIIIVSAQDILLGVRVLSFRTNPNFEFLKLTQILYPQHRQLIENINKMFTGEPDKILVNLEQQGQQRQENQEQANEQGKNQANAQQEADENEENEKVLKKNLTEINRLSVVVRSIENDCQITPVGSYKMSPQHSLQLNQTYKSPSLSHALNLSNWQHFRAPQSPQKRKQIQQQSVIFNNSFLDPIVNDEPIGCWSSQHDISDAVVSVRNLLWPGYFAYQKLNSSLFGSCYFGDGSKNVNLAFQL